MELRQLRYFLAVANELHFARAAQLLRISQPPLTVAVRKLERELGTELFVRSTRSVALTAAGQAFKVRVESVLEELEEAVGDVGEVVAGRSGKLKIGFVSSASYTAIPEAIRTFRQRRPRVELVLSPLTSGEQVESLLEGELDLGLIRDPDKIPGLNLELLSSEDLVAVVPEFHPLASADEIEPGMLEGQPLVLFPYRLMPGYVSRIMTLLEPARTPPYVVQQAIHQETVLGLVAAGLGISILPRSVTRFRMPGVQLRPFADRPQTELHIARGKVSSPAADEFVSCLKRVSGVSQEGLQEAEEF